MRRNAVPPRSDRSYLCLLAIYAIHAILLNFVFTPPSFEDTRIGVSSRSSRPVDGRASTASVDKNTSETATSASTIIQLVGDRIGLSSRTNATERDERKNIAVVREEADVCLRKLPTRAFTQSKSGGAAIHFVSILKASNVLNLMNKAINTARSIIERLTPATLGIISGCLVFLVTFTENDCV